MEHQSDSLEGPVYAFSGRINSVQPRRQSEPDSASVMASRDGERVCA